MANRGGANPDWVSDPLGAGLNSFPKLLERQAKARGRRPALRFKDLGIWQTWDWQQLQREVHELAGGLAAMGFARGDKLAIVSENRPRMYAAMSAVQALGGVPVPLYQDAVADEMAQVLDHADARFALVQDQEQVDKLLEIQARCSLLEQIIYDDPRGLRNYDQDHVHDFSAVQATGRAWLSDRPEFLAGEIARGGADDIAIMLYTSGTTGQPKGVMLSNRNLIVQSANGLLRDGLSAEEEVLAYLPMAWVGDNLISFAQALVAGYCVSCPEAGDTVMADLREIGPSYFFAPPRIWENLLTQMTIRMEDASRPKRILFDACIRLARRVGPNILDGRPVRLSDRLLYAAGSVLVYGPLKNVIGFSRIRLALTAGEAIGPEIFEFFRALGINIKQLYGSTESTVFICVQPDGEVKPDTVGKPVRDVELRLADNGEILFRGPGVFHSYYKNPEATAQTIDEQGWAHTGDVGVIDRDGHLKIIDRAKDVGRLLDGTLFAPKYLENKLKFFPYIKEAVAFGNERQHVTAFINIDIEAVGNWAERRKLPYSGYTDLARKDAVAGLIRSCVAKVNKDLASDPDLAGSQIRRFLILHKELDPDDDELTRTRKIRRRFIGEKYAELIEALYGDAKRHLFETQIRYEDGRTGTLSADLKLLDVECFPHAVREAA